MYNSLIVLDIDCTLIDSDISNTFSNQSEGKNKIIKYLNYSRPLLNIFLKECFAKFKYVAIWTAANKYWADNFVKNILKVDKNKFLFVWDIRKCVPIKNNISSIFTYSKPLEKIWSINQIKNLGLNQSNIFIVDDRKVSGIFNIENHILIPNYKFNKNDNALGQLIIYFRELDWTDCREAIKKISLYRYIKVH